jgi:hypothetical protein
LINDFFTLDAPNTQATLDLLGVKWISKVPLEKISSGKIPLFEDARIDALVLADVSW